MVLLVVLGKWLSHGALASKTLRHLHEPSHELWYSPLAMKLLVKVGNSWEAQGSYCLSNHEPHRES
ncbi:hypothetical protein H5410_031989 [Solanum commersonii]|uniref:Uncharacterized protein n=1 Tax=Solanum commersonii TaxID=4109 RepID=A0A9J5YIP8_SOLCO|nr:hypothetical protein H5410_031989 [Solanum commersonii]